jgi:hypothetical protein
MRVSFFLYFALLFFQTKANFYFTLIGSRTFVFGSEYELFITRNRNENNNLKLNLELKGEKFGESFEKSVNLDIQETFVKFDVSFRHNFEGSISNLI